MWKIEDIRKAQFEFYGKYGVIALFTNPFFFVRKNLYKNIRRYSKYMRGVVMDFGCGAKPYRGLFTNCVKYIGLDTDISGHSHNGEDVDVKYDGKNIPFGENEIDSIFSSEVFEHVEDIHSIMDELHRVLKPGGYMLITAPFVWNEHEIPYDFRRFTSYGIRKIVKKSGFDIIQSRKSTSYMETIFQMFAEYIRYEIAKRTDNRVIKILGQRLLIAPVILVGCLISSLFPANWSLYGDNIILCKKI